MQELVILLKDLSGSARFRRLVESHAEHLIRTTLADGGALFGAGLAIAVHAEDVLRDLTVANILNVICDNKEQIETGEKRIG